MFARPFIRRFFASFCYTYSYM